MANLAKYQFRLECVQHKFLSYATYKLNLTFPQHNNYSFMSCILNKPFFSSHQIAVETLFIHALLNKTLYVSDLLFRVSFEVPSYNNRTQISFHIPTHFTSYIHLLHRKLRPINHE